jgi:hypothetical protein
MKRRWRGPRLGSRFLVLGGVVAGAALLPLYGDPRPSPVTHPEWARMILRSMDLLASVPLSEQASQVFATLSWKNSLAYRADRYMSASGVTVQGEGENRRLEANAAVGEVSYPVAVARAGDYRVRLLLSGNPATPAETEIRVLGEDKPEKVFTVPGGSSPAWADAGSVHLDPGSYSATVLLPKGTSLEYVELAPPCLSPIEPIGGWKATAIATTGDVAVSVLKAIEQEHQLPPSDSALEIEASEIKLDGPLALEASYGAMPGLGGMWLKAGDKGSDGSVSLDLPEDGLYSISVFGVTGGGLRFTADACRKSVLCAEPTPTNLPRWRQIFSGQFAAGRHFLTMSMGRGAAVQRLRIERKKDAVAEYVATVRRLGLDLGPDGPITRDRATAAMRFIKAQRGLDTLTVCRDVLDREPTTLVAAAGTGQPALPPGAGGPVAPGAPPGTSGPQPPGQPPLTPPVIPPQNPGSPTVP